MRLRARREPDQRYERWQLAKRLGLARVAMAIHDRYGPWIVPTAAAQFALQSAGMWPIDHDPEPEP